MNVRRLRELLAVPSYLQCDSPATMLLTSHSSLRAACHNAVCRSGLGSLAGAGFYLLVAGRPAVVFPHAWIAVAMAAARDGYET